MSDIATTRLLKKETELMVQRAINSAGKHGIQLRHGTSNPGVGDCAFEAIIQNNNERSCYRENYEMGINWYRRIWMTDMANRSRNTYNIYTEQQWQEGWAQMLIPGTYERGIFGDLMLPGIACGIKKILLIFNTSLNTPHDPIYVVNPIEFNVQPDTEIPIILAYNMSHYESMEPCRQADIQATINLVKEYQDGNYRFGRADIHFLLAETNKQDDSERNDRKSGNKTSNSKIFADERVIDQGHTDTKNERENIKSFDKRSENEEGQLKDDNLNNIYFKYKNVSKEIIIEQADGKMQCPTCKDMVKNLNLHFLKRLECSNNIDLVHFQSNFEEYKKRRYKQDTKERKEKSRKKKIEEDPEQYRKNKAEA